ncbi:hypothetical protein FRAHR75_40105 [Frankia sp. Hr75.2]|nr:hypothetical protein FRAHR75_40105 [Frankia sp. Hr75.2]
MGSYASGPTSLRAPPATATDKSGVAWRSPDGLAVRYDGIVEPSRPQQRTTLTDCDGRRIRTSHPKAPIIIKIGQEVVIQLPDVDRNGHWTGFAKTRRLFRLKYLRFAARTVTIRVGPGGGQGLKVLPHPRRCMDVWHGGMAIHRTTIVNAAVVPFVHACPTICDAPEHAFAAHSRGSPGARPR